MSGRFYADARLYDRLFPGGVPLLLSLAGLRLVDRFGDWSGRPFTGDAAIQLCVCEAD